MHLLYNGHIVLEEELQLPLTNRAFQYNDGFFETIMMREGRLQFWPDHLARMREAAATLKLELPASLTQAYIEEEFRTLAHCNTAMNYGRIKLKVWRAGAGLYTPETNSTEWYASIQPAGPVAVGAARIGICRNVRTIYSPLSHFKGPNALLYVLASLEKEERRLDDLLLLSQQGMVAELVASNIFWIVGRTLYTPALDTGCVNGIIRRNILRWCRLEGIKVAEGHYDAQVLHQAEVVFAANVTGIRTIISIEGNQLQQGHPLPARLQNALFS